MDYLLLQRRLYIMNILYHITRHRLAFKVIREKGLKTALALKKRKEGQG